MLTIEQLHARTCAELVSMCRELGVAHSGRRKQLLVQALFDYQRQNGPIPPQVVSRATARGGPVNGGSRYQTAPIHQAQHSSHALPHGSASHPPRGVPSINPYSPSGAAYNVSQSLGYTAQNPANAYRQPVTTFGPAQHHEALLAASAVAQSTSRRAGPVAAGANKSGGISMSTFAGSPPTGPKGGAAPGAAGAVTVGPTERGAGPSGMYGQCLCHGAVGQPSARKGHISALNCTRCGGLNHVACYPASYNTQNFVCSMCRMKRLDPFYPVREVLWDARLEVSHYVFELNAQNLRKWRAEGKEVVVRCMQVDLQPLYQSWPKSINIIVNGRTEESVAAPSWEHKRRDMPIPITQYLKNSRNRIEFTWTNFDDPKVFHLAVFLCDTRSPDVLANEVWKQGRIAEPQALQRVLDIINNRQGENASSKSSGSGSDSEEEEVMCLEVTRRIKLVCPVTFTRIEVPCRGRSCLHLQCYDLAGYLLVTKNTKAFNTRWKCPECHLYVRPDELVIDGFVQKVLADTDEDATVVELEQDASYRVVTEKELTEESKRAEEQRQLASGEDLRALAADEGRLNEGGSQPTEGPPRKAFEVVEMLSDSDEETEEQGASPPGFPPSACPGVSSVPHGGPTETAESSEELRGSAETAESPAPPGDPAVPAATSEAASASGAPVVTSPQGGPLQTTSTFLSPEEKQIHKDKQQPAEPTGDAPSGCDRPTGSEQGPGVPAGGTGRHSSRSAGGAEEEACSDDEGRLPPQKRARRLVVPSPGDSPRSSHATSPTRTPPAAEGPRLLSVPSEGENATFSLPAGTGQLSSASAPGQEGNSSCVTATQAEGPVGVDSSGAKAKSVEHDDVDILVVLSSDEDAEENTDTGATLPSQSAAGRPGGSLTGHEAVDTDDGPGCEPDGETVNDNGSGGEGRKFERWSAAEADATTTCVFKHELPSDGHLSSCSGSSPGPTSSVMQNHLPPVGAMTTMDFACLAAGTGADNPISISDSSEDEEGAWRSKEGDDEVENSLPAFQGNNSADSGHCSGLDDRPDTPSKEKRRGRAEDDNPETDERARVRLILPANRAVGEGPSEKTGSVCSENEVPGDSGPSDVGAPSIYAKKRGTHRGSGPETSSAEGQRSGREQDACTAFGVRNTGQGQAGMETAGGARLNQDGHTVQSPTRRPAPVVPPPLFGHRGTPKQGSSDCAGENKEESSRGSVAESEGGEQTGRGSAERQSKGGGESVERHGEIRRRNGSVVGGEDVEKSTREVIEPGVRSRRRSYGDSEKGERTDAETGEAAERRRTDRGGEEKPHRVSFERRMREEERTPEEQPEERTQEDGKPGESCTPHPTTASSASPSSRTARASSWWDNASSRLRKGGPAAVLPSCCDHVGPGAVSDSTSLRDPSPVTSSFMGCSGTSNGTSGGGVACRQAEQSCGPANQHHMSADSSAAAPAAHESQNAARAAALPRGEEAGDDGAAARQEAAAGIQTHHHDSSSSRPSATSPVRHPTLAAAARGHQNNKEIGREAQIQNNKDVGADAQVRALSTGSSQPSHGPAASQAVSHVSGPGQSALPSSCLLPAATPGRPVSVPPLASSGGAAPFLVPGVHRGSTSVIRVPSGLPQNEQLVGLLGTTSGHRLRTPEQQLALELHRQRLQRKNQEDLQELLNQQRATKKFVDTSLGVAGGGPEGACRFAAQHSGVANSCPGLSHTAAYLDQSSVHGVLRGGTSSQAQPQHDSSNECFFSRPSHFASSGPGDRFRVGSSAANAETWNQFRNFLNVEGDDARTSRALTNLFGGPDPRDGREERLTVSSYVGAPSLVVDEPLTGGEVGGAARGGWTGRGDPAYREPPIQGPSRGAPLVPVRASGVYPHQLFDQGRGRVSSRPEPPRGRHGWGV